MADGEHVPAGVLVADPHKEQPLTQPLQLQELLGTLTQAVNHMTDTDWQHTSSQLHADSGSKPYD